MMMEVFGKVSMPFYKFGAICFLEKSTKLFGLNSYQENSETPERTFRQVNVKRLSNW